MWQSRSHVTVTQGRAQGWEESMCARRPRYNREGGILALNGNRLKTAFLIGGFYKLRSGGPNVSVNEKREFFGHQVALKKITYFPVLYKNTVALFINFFLKRHLVIRSNDAQNTLRDLMQIGTELREYWFSFKHPLSFIFISRYFYI